MVTLREAVWLSVVVGLVVAVASGTDGELVKVRVTSTDAVTPVTVSCCVTECDTVGDPVSLHANDRLPVTLPETVRQVPVAALVGLLEWVPSIVRDAVTVSEYVTVAERCVEALPVSLRVAVVDTSGEVETNAVSETDVVAVSVVVADGVRVLVPEIVHNEESVRVSVRDRAAVTDSETDSVSSAVDEAEVDSDCEREALRSAETDSVDDGDADTDVEALRERDGLSDSVVERVAVALGISECDRLVVGVDVPRETDGEGDAVEEVDAVCIPVSDAVADPVADGLKERVCSCVDDALVETVAEVESDSVTDAVAVSSADTEPVALCEMVLLRVPRVGVSDTDAVTELVRVGAIDAVTVRVFVSSDVGVALVEKESVPVNDTVPLRICVVDVVPVALSVPEMSDEAENDAEADNDGEAVVVAVGDMETVSDSVVVMEGANVALLVADSVPEKDAEKDDVTVGDRSESESSSLCECEIDDVRVRENLVKVRDAETEAVGSVVMDPEAESVTDSDVDTENDTVGVKEKNVCERSALRDVDAVDVVENDSVWLSSDV